jgi:hypothetical protein
MNGGFMFHASTQRIGTQLAVATAVATGATWTVLVLLSGNLIPRSTLVAAALAVAFAFCAFRAARERQIHVLVLGATFGALTPPDLGAAPEVFRYVGFLAVGYPIAAILMLSPSFPSRRIG